MTKAEVASRLPIRRGLTEAEAAIYVGIGSTLFRRMVIGGKMPRARLLEGAKSWDVSELDAAYRSLPRDGGETISDWQDFENGGDQT